MVSRELLIEKVKSHKKAAIIIGCTVALLFLVILLVASCVDASNSSHDDENSRNSAHAQSQSEQDSATKTTIEKTLEQSSEGSISEETESGEQNSDNVSQTANTNSTNSVSKQAAPSESSNQSTTTSSTPNNPSTTQSPTAPEPEPERQWVQDTQQVWVEDSAAWDETVEIYGYTEHSICNIYGADITGNEVAHGKSHMMTGEGSGHHTEWMRVVTGANIVHHDATGHWETQVVGGHWE